MDDRNVREDGQRPHRPLAKRRRQPGDCVGEPDERGPGHGLLDRALELESRFAHRAQREGVPQPLDQPLRCRVHVQGDDRVGIDAGRLLGEPERRLETARAEAASTPAALPEPAQPALLERIQKFFGLK